MAPKTTTTKKITKPVAPKKTTAKKVATKSTVKSTKPKKTTTAKKEVKISDSRVVVINGKKVQLPKRSEFTSYSCIWRFYLVTDKKSKDKIMERKWIVIGDGHKRYRKFDTQAEAVKYFRSLKKYAKMRVQSVHSKEFTRTIYTFFEMFWRNEKLEEVKIQKASKGRPSKMDDEFDFIDEYSQFDTNEIDDKSFNEEEINKVLAESEGEAVVLDESQYKKPQSKATQLDKNKEHIIVLLEEYYDYDYNKRRTQWHEKAGSNVVQEICSVCKDDDNWASILLETGDHVCYYCWMKKPIQLKMVKKSTAKKESVKTIGFIEDQESILESKLNNVIDDELVSTVYKPEEAKQEHDLAKIFVEEEKDDYAVTTEVVYEEVDKTATNEIVTEEIVATTVPTNNDSSYDVTTEVVFKEPEKTKTNLFELAEDETTSDEELNVVNKMSEQDEIELTQYQTALTPTSDSDNVADGKYRSKMRALFWISIVIICLLLAGIVVVALLYVANIFPK